MPLFAKRKLAGPGTVLRLYQPEDYLPDNED
jgi:hypothetical protein